MKILFLIALVVDMTVGGLFALGLLSPVAQAESGDSVQTRIMPDVAGISRSALVSPLQDVEQQIEDEEIAEFYHRLLQKYDLGDPRSGEQGGGGHGR
jgi:hypothetical protein